MRSSFPGYYTPTDEEFEMLWQEGCFVCDANVLLGIYRYSPSTRNELLDILRTIQDRLWIPHQAALEYQQNRLNVIAQQETAYRSVSEELTSSEEQIEINLRRLRNHHSYIDTDEILKQIKEVFEKIRSELADQQDEHPDLLRNDSIREVINELLENKVGPPYSSKELEDIYKQGRIRYSAKIPPGYKDDNKEENKKYGDLILWRQTISYAQEVKTPIILITDDRKEDWWWKSHGKTIGPRPELVQEMASEANVSFYMYTIKSFLKYAENYLKLKVKEETITEIESTRQREEELDSQASFVRDYIRRQRVFENFLNSTAINWPTQLDQARISEIFQDAQRFNAYLNSTAINWPTQLDQARISEIFQDAQRFNAYLNSTAINRESQLPISRDYFENTVNSVINEQEDDVEASSGQTTSTESELADSDQEDMDQENNSE